MTDQGPDRVDLAIRAGQLRDEVRYLRSLINEFLVFSDCDKRGCTCTAARARRYLRGQKL